ncbi:MAG: acyltransferase [Alphaproteobacteria bacterium]|nr:acyltransferase [Alphaproteobacteria bacterium]
MSRTLASAAPATTPRADPRHDAAGFRPDIEGLRALCVGAVVAFHAFPAMLPGGFIGVDVFFVISGFLITQLLVREIEATGRIDLVDFWARRIRRILPAATLVLCATAVMALFVSAIDARLIGRHIIAAALFYYNWRQAGEAVDYLAQDDRDNPLLHYWSLAVEEQFYLVWPLLLAGTALWLKRCAPRQPAGAAIGIVVGVIAVASLTYCVAVTWANPALAFFDTFARAWQLLAGAMAAVAANGMRSRRPGLSGAIGVACVGVLIASCLLISERTAYPGVAAVAPTLAAALLLLFGGAPGAWPSAILSAAPLRYVGRISFSWYLWHWPLIVFAGMTAAGSGEAPGEAQSAPALIAIAVSFSLAAATYRFVEQPFRHSVALKASRRKTYAVGALLIAAGAASGVAMRAFGPDTVALGNGTFMSLTAIKQDRPVIYSDRCLLRFEDVSYSPCVYGAAAGTRTVVLFGDSHAGNWFSAIDTAARKQGWRLLVRIKASCRPIEAEQIRGNGQPYPECEAWRSRVMAELIATKPDLIVVSSMTNPLPAASEQVTFRWLAGIAPTVVMRDTPVLPETPGDCLKRTSNAGDCVWRFEDLRSPNSYPKSKSADLPAGVSILDVNPRICPNGVCRAITDGRVLMSDKHHLSDSFSRTLAGEFERLLAPAGK